MSSQDLVYGKPFIFKLINSELDYPIDPDNFLLENPIFTLGDLNTTVKLSPTLGSAGYGKHSFSYNRLVLNDLDSPLVIVVNGETTLKQLLPKINALELFDKTLPSPLTFLDELNVPYIGDSEIDDKPLPPFGSSGQTYVTMVARTNSYILSGLVEIRLIKP